MQIEIRDHKGNVVDKDTINVKKSTKLIFQCPEKFSTQDMANLFKAVESLLTSENKHHMVIPKSIEIKVLNIK